MSAWPRAPHATLAARVALAALPMLGAGCDDRQVLHAPSPTLARMLDQPRVDPFESPMGTPPEDTVARGEPGDDAPMPEITAELLALGRARFDVICATCHGIVGDGVSVVAAKMELRKPPSLHEPRLRAMTHADTFAVITRGYGLMPPLAHELPPRERWAVVAYLDALRLARGASVADLPPDLRAAAEGSAR